jgi:hypothetical protein
MLGIGLGLMKRIGSPNRETLEEANMKLVSKLVSRSSYKSVILQDEVGQKSLWGQNGHYAGYGYVVEVDGVGYEFICSVK